MGWYENMNRFVGEQMDKFSVWLDAHPGKTISNASRQNMPIIVAHIANNFRPVFLQEYLAKISS